MPLYRYKDLDEARRALWFPAGDPVLVREWHALFELSRLAPLAPPCRGIKKFRTIDEANQDSEAWIAERVKAGRARIV